MKKILCFIMVLFVALTMTSCRNKDNDELKTLGTPTNVAVSNQGLITWDSVKDATSYTVMINEVANQANTNSYQVVDLTKDFTVYVIAKANGYKDSNASSKVTFTAVKIPTPSPSTIQVAINGPSQVKSGAEAKLQALVSGTDNTAVTWKIVEGEEYATIALNGTFTAKETKEDRIVKIVATSDEDSRAYAEKVLTIVGKPDLTQAMLDALNEDKVAFEGYVNISLYTIGVTEKYETNYTTTIKTAMNGTNWYSEYENGNTGTTMSLYYKKYNDKACQVGVSFMNEEEYYPMEDEFGNEISWTDAGLYNCLKGLSVDDFTFNTETWMYEYTGSNKKLPQLLLSAANPYDFDPKGFSLILEEGEVMGIYSMSNDDYTILDGYKAIQELYVAMNLGDSVEVPTIAKYSHDDIHDPLVEAIANMQNLSNYTLDFTEMTSYMGSTAIPQGFTETITNEICHFRPYTFNNYGYETQETVYTPNATYGYKKISNDLYNTYFEYEEGYVATRAYEADFVNTKPTFAFAAEIFREYYIDNETGEITYYVDSVMSPVASTFYYGVGNDINLYGIFASDYLANYTPYVVVKDGYIIEAGFGFFVGSVYGAVQIKYSDFNTATLPAETNVTFETRLVPTSWDQLVINVSGESSSTTADDEEVNALEYFKEFYDNENIGEELPFFGNVLGDTFGFGLTQLRIPGGSNIAKKTVVLYYDVPLDIDYTINESLEKIENYLLELGFVKNSHGEFLKGDIAVAPIDSSLDLLIYVWKA